MEWLSKYIIAAVAAWVIANLVKVMIHFAQSKKISQQPIFNTGGMPSVHTAPVVSLTTTIGLLDGVQSPIFAIAAVFSIVVMTDAVKTRRAVGEQGKALQKLLPKSQKQPYSAIGHRPIEVFVGGIIGLAVGIAVAFL
jgi:acid phosphatase family membrane protein YuiD